MQKLKKNIFSMKKWGTNELRQPTSRLISWFISSLKWIVLEPKNHDIFYKNI